MQATFSPVELRLVNAAIESLRRSRVRPTAVVDSRRGITQLGNDSGDASQGLGVR